MKQKIIQSMAIGGTIFTWVPILAPVFFSLVSLVTRGRFRFDYLMPAELFPVVLLGAILLIAAAAITHQRRALIGSAFGVMMSILFIGQAIAVVTGLASGETEPDGWQWTLVLGSLAIYSLCILIMGVGGALLTRDLFRRTTA